MYRLNDEFDSFNALIFKSSGASAANELRKWYNGELYNHRTAAYGLLNWGQIDIQAQAEIIALAEAEFGDSTYPIDKKKIEFLKGGIFPDYELIFDVKYIGTAGYPGSDKYITVSSTVMNALSQGNVHINPANPIGKPFIDHRFFSNEHDINLASRASSLRLREFAVNTVTSFYHPVGTFSLLREAEDHIVDAYLLVYGT
ncbi:GMC oxidoreductase [Colletotrichum orchidophilum]|uniref:GMC oxidoreductase n=1 Tax=Colletotrichum orchidophilum TaxID=1209926 RepID=A0A1G4AUT0_9PEZI|nr:GMC oxidoreductase [Colletotrichum orchidophilum]OHE92929.1 GMC oxidoreductase [Colletotrichum orchidophilum]